MLLNNLSNIFKVIGLPNPDFELYPNHLVNRAAKKPTLSTCIILVSVNDALKILSEKGDIQKLEEKWIKGEKWKH